MVGWLAARRGSYLSLKRPHQNFPLIFPLNLVSRRGMCLALPPSLLQAKDWKEERKRLEEASLEERRKVSWT